MSDSDLERKMSGNSSEEDSSSSDEEDDSVDEKNPKVW